MGFYFPSAATRVYVERRCVSAQQVGEGVKLYVCQCHSGITMCQRLISHMRHNRMIAVYSSEALDIQSTLTSTYALLDLCRPRFAKG